MPSLLAHRPNPAHPLAALAGLAAALTMVVAVWVGTSLGTDSLAGTAAHRGGASLPAAARGPVSAALGAHDAGYRVDGLQARNRAQRLEATFSPTGVSVAAGKSRARLGLTGYGRGRAVRAVRPVAPQATGNRVDYRHGSVHEWWANGPLGLEQSFDVRSRPAGATGPMVLSLALAGDRPARRDGSGVVLDGGLRYGGLVATDARGRTLPSHLELRGDRLAITVDDRNAAYPVRVDPFVQAAALTESDGEASDLFGVAVATSGDTIAAGSLTHQAGRRTRTSSVYVFERPASGWANATEEAKLTPSDGDIVSLTALAMTSDTIVVGSDSHKVGDAVGQGAAMVFVKPAGGWKDARETAVLTASDGKGNEGLGSGVAVSGDTVVATASGHQVGDNQVQGAAYVYVKPAAGWTDMTQTAELTASDGAQSDGLGPVAMSGDTIVAGASAHKVGNNANQGAAYVFVKPAGAWKNATQTAELTSSDGLADDAFGSAVAMSGDTVAIGAPAAKVGAANHQGLAYVFVKPAGGWANAHENAELTASDGRADDRLGTVVAVSGDRVAASTFRLFTDPSPPPGTIYLFAKPGASWASTSQTEKLSAPGATGPDAFGIAVAMSGGVVVAGAPFETVGQNGSEGVVHLFGVPPGIAITSPGDGATFAQGQAVTASYTCTAPTGVQVTACAGPVPTGTALDTSAPGAHSFTVNAGDSEGVNASRTVNYTVSAPPAPPGSASAGSGSAGSGSAGNSGAGAGGGPSGGSGPGATATGAPALTGVRQSATVWRRGGKLAGIAARRPVGTDFTFALDQAATVSLRFTTTRKARGGRKRTATAGALTLPGHAGTNRVHFEGRISRGKRLKPGRYTVQITATNAAGQRTTAKALTFRIVG